MPTTLATPTTSLPLRDQEVWLCKAGVNKLYGVIEHDTDGRRIFRRGIEPQNVFRKWDGIAVDAVILEHLDRVGVVELRYGVQGEDHHYAATTGYVRANGLYRVFGKPPWPTYILPRVQWQRLEGPLPSKPDQPNPLRVTIEVHDAHL
jgi:hypothetical protein